MSVPSPPAAFGVPEKSTGRVKPRWSWVASVTPPLEPLSITGLLGCSASVCVGPPLLPKAAASSGFEVRSVASGAAKPGFLRLSSSPPSRS